MEQLTLTLTLIWTGTDWPVVLRLSVGEDLGDSVGLGLGDSLGHELGDSRGHELGEALGDELEDELGRGGFYLAACGADDDDDCCCLLVDWEKVGQTAMQNCGTDTDHLPDNTQTTCAPCRIN